MNFHRNLFIALLIPSILLAVLMYSFRELYIAQFGTIVNKILQKKPTIYEPPRKPVLWNNIDYYLLDENFNIIGSPFKSYIPLNNEKFLVKNEQNMYKILDKQGNDITPYKYLSTKRLNKKYLLVTYENKQQGIIDFDGNEHIKANKITEEYESAHLIVNTSDDNYTIYDYNLNKILELKSSDTPDIINKKYIVIKKGAFVSLIDFNHNTIIPFEYRNIKSTKFVENHFLITLNGKMGIVNDKNEVVIPPIFSYINVYEKDGEKFYLAERDYSYAKFSLQGEFSELKELPNKSLIMKIKPLINQTVETTDDIPIRHIEVTDTREKPRTKVKRQRFMKEEEFQKLVEKQIDDNETYLKFAKLENQPKHKSDYKSDFLNPKKQGDFVKLVCHEYNNFCNLSKNGLSAKYAGRESLYAISREKTSGKYYFEYQVFDKEDENINTNSNFGMYKQSKENNELETSFIPKTSSRLKSGDIVGIAIDFDNGFFHYSINGKWKSNPNDKKGTYGEKFARNRKFTNIPALTVAGYKEHLIVNFGNQPFKYKMPEDYEQYK